jgi:hypothetical protein
VGLARPTLAVGQVSTPTVGLAKPMLAMVWRNPCRPWSGGSGEHAGRLDWVSPVVTLRDPLTASPKAKPTYSTRRNPPMGKPTMKPHPRRKPTHSICQNPPTSKPHPRRNPPTSKPHPRRNPPTTHVKTHPHRNPWRNPIHGENHPRRGSCGSSQVHERSLPARRVWPSSLRGSFVFLFFFFLRAIQCIRIYVILMYFFSFF